MEDYETALLIVEHFGRKFRSMQVTAQRVGQLAGSERQMNMNSPDAIFNWIMKNKSEELGLKKKAEVPEDTTLAPEEIKEMKDLIDRVKHRTPPAQKQPETQAASSST